MKSKRDFYAYGFTLVMALFMYQSAANFVYSSSRLMPELLAIGIVILSLAGLIKATIKYRSKAVVEEKKEKKRHGDRQVKPYLLHSLWFFGLFVGIWLIGFLPSSVIFILAYLRVNKVSWLKSAVTAGATAVVVYGLFVFLLEVELFSGILFGARI